MADTTASELQRLQLSAADLKSITSEIKPGEPWPDALVEDYLNILRDLVLLANTIDENAGEIIRSINRAFSLISANKSVSAQNRAKINQLNDEISELNAGINGLFDFFPVKACAFEIDGNGVLDPTINHSYNTASITRSGVGVYDVTLSQGTINGQSIDARATYSIEWTIPGPGGVATDQYRVEVSSPLSGTSFQLSVYSVVVGAGGPLSNLLYQPYDLVTGERVSLNILMNAGAGTLPPP